MGIFFYGFDTQLDGVLLESPFIYSRPYLCSFHSKRVTGIHSAIPIILTSCSFLGRVSMEKLQSLFIS